MAEQIDHNALAVSRLVTEFRESPKLKGYIEALLSEANPLEQVLQDVITERWLDNAVGTQLDILGEIVGQSRILVDATIVFYFGFDPAPGAQSFGSVSSPSVGGRFRDVDESTTGNRTLTDDEYRVFIKARIIKNSIIPTLQETVDFFKFLFSVNQVIILDGDMFYIVQIGRLLTLNEKAFLSNTDLIPKVAGVAVSYQEYEEASAFGFGGVPNSLGFGSVSNPLIGGKFASII